MSTAPDFYIPSALYFYKALKVYPAPAELAQIYQKTQPPAVFALVMELISLEYVYIPPPFLSTFRRL